MTPARSRALRPLPAHSAPSLKDDGKSEFHAVRMSGEIKLTESVEGPGPESVRRDGVRSIHPLVSTLSRRCVSRTRSAALPSSAIRGWMGSACPEPPTGVRSVDHARAPRAKRVS
jgi:hypothetical protein